MNAILLIVVFLTLIIVLGICGKSNFDFEGEFSAVPPKFKIKLKNRPEKPAPAKTKKKT